MPSTTFNPETTTPDITLPASAAIDAKETTVVGNRINGHSNKVNGHGNSVNCRINGVNGYRQPAYTVVDQPLGTVKPVRIICIGAGASGINMAYQTKNFLRNVELVIYEKNPKIGGTWFENRYPGCKCDIRKFQ
jgi:hypothetical protein